MPTIDEIRDVAEQDVEDALAKLDAAHRAKLRTALRRYGSVEAIPETVWREIAGETERELAALLLLVMVAADDWTTGRIVDQGAPRKPLRQQALAGYSLTAAGKAAQTALQTTETLRDRLRREVENARLGDRGDVGDLTDDGIDEALDEVFTPERRKTTATNETTGAISAGQIGSRDRHHEPGAGGSIEIDLIWRTEGDNRVCPRCSPLNGTTEDVWGRVFPDGPGQAAHPNCRCSLDPRVRPKEPTE